MSKHIYSILGMDLARQIISDCIFVANEGSDRYADEELPRLKKLIEIYTIGVEQYEKIHPHIDLD